MDKPIVAIVGRPNVGKSTFFNQIVGKRISIVDDQPGVTRDRIYADAEWLNRKFTLVDTGGLDPESDDELLVHIRRQVEIAIDTADVIIFLVDGQVGVTPADQQIANLLRRTKKPVVLAVNKIDNREDESMVLDFFSLGLGEPIGISATHKRGIGDLLDRVVKHLPDKEVKEEEDQVIKIAVVGRPNVGKSSLVNRILGEERVIVSDIPGTTRDAIDTPFEMDGREYVIIDTAGIRRKSRINEALERYSVLRALAAIRRCDVALIMLDATQPVAEQDAKIAGLVHEEGKASVIVVNKWDLVEKDTYTMEEYKNRILQKLGFIAYAPMVFISARTGQRVNRVLELVDEVYSRYTMRVSTGVLNDCISDAVAVAAPPSEKGRMLKIYYVTQVSVKPPTFVLFVNDPELMHDSYQRYLENYLRKMFGLTGTPIRLLVRQRS
ncbi:ribosome biogenesis GTPase Der [Caldicoprobacter algeriensis]|uniref:ribosome biogenesis GTPase Der n=1 Tax=Caldicoprobacter algeriensis TaxID=699281 RepID=UPI002079EDCD|nr:ribosome biogenesis GTPase Der [Caldicoprobacter algeriensis]MCM8901124.1 ribosome biogenesis GTPase Der [Caldicoprobacter algeriensis]